MRRVHFVELEDLDWMPGAIRDGGTDLLDTFFGLVKFYQPLVDVLERAIDASGGQQVVDLCSGGGGGALFMARALAARGRTDVRFLLTDRHPNEATIGRTRGLANVAVHGEPVDAMHVPSDLRGLRTMFGALHHFPPEAIHSLLADAVASGAHVAFFDVAANPMMRKMPAPLSPFALLPNALVLFTLPFALVPLVRPVRASRWLLTYLVPLIPFLFAWDGTVSALRAYAPEELLDIARGVPGTERYAWASEKGGMGLYLTGRPKAS
ncbi:MAG: hypothetical protein U0414_27300 [Polyangiaceae bacterium]